MSPQHAASHKDVLLPPAPTWRLLALLCLVILAGVCLSFAAYFFARGEVAMATAEQVERPLITESSHIQTGINTTYNLLGSLQQIIRTNSMIGVEQLQDFIKGNHQVFGSRAIIYMLTLDAYDDDRRVELSGSSAFLPWPQRVLDQESDLRPLVQALQGGREMQTGIWQAGDEFYLTMMSSCTRVRPQCLLVALVPLDLLFRGINELVRQRLIDGYSIYNVKPTAAGLATTEQRLITRHTAAGPRYLTVLPEALLGYKEAVLKAQVIALPTQSWSIGYYASQYGSDQLIMLLPSLVMAIGLLLTGLSVVYVMNNHDYRKDVYSLTGSLRTSNNLLQERIKAEAAMAQALRASERKYRAIFENAGIGICQIAPNGRWLDANPRMAAILGYENAQAILRAQPDFHGALFLDPQHRRDFLAGLERADQHDTELAIRRLDGSKAWGNMRGHVVRNHQEATLYYECTMYDVTQRRLSEQALVAAKEQADFASRSKSEFLANMSHELRTPLNAIIGFSEIIRDQMLGPEGTAQYQEYASDIHDSGELLLSLINDILDMSKIEAGKRVLSESVIDVERVIQSCIRLVVVRAKANKLNLTHDLPPLLYPLRAEERAVKQVLANLLTNAIKFTPEGGTVKISAYLDPLGRMALAVSDTGIGIAPEDIANALAPFGQIESVISRRTQGTGLGLPLTKALVELHGGELRIDSQIGQGTTVTALFPAERVVMRVTS
jgi:PAS domain S-box-containing protein